MPGINWQRWRIITKYPTAQGQAGCDLRYQHRPAVTPSRPRFRPEMSVTIRRFPKQQESD